MSNSSALGLAVNHYFQDKSRIVICNEETGVMTSPRVVTIWRQAEEAAKGNVLFALHYSDAFLTMKIHYNTDKSDLHN